MNDHGPCYGEEVESSCVPTSEYLSLIVNGQERHKCWGPVLRYYDQFRPSAFEFDYEHDVIEYQKYMARHGPEIAVPDSAKCNKMAKELRVRAKALFQNNEFQASLRQYGASVCWAEPDTSAVGSGYAGRAAVYHRLGEFEYSLINIKLAKENGYPERYWPTVDRYEQDCQQKLREGRSKSVGREPKLGLNVEPNPAIPFFARGIRTEQVPGYGRGLIAERDFTSGDVILHEKPMLTALQYGVEHGKCSFCTTPIMPRLVPCPDCVTAVYCSKRCLEEDKKWFHLYECGIMAKLEHISNRAFPLGPRMLLYGLGLFNGDLDQFMNFCKANDRTGSDPLTLDYTNPDRLEEFKAFHCAKEPPTMFDYTYLSKFTAALYTSIYMKQPRVASLFRSKDQRYFFLAQTLDYMRMAMMLNIGQSTPYDWYTSQHFSIASLCNHACYPNTMALYHAGHLKFVAVRRIDKGEQITIPYVSPVEEYACREDQIKNVMENTAFTTCICDLCDPEKFLSLKMKLLNRTPVCVDAIRRQVLAAMQNGNFQQDALRQFCEQHLRELPSTNEGVQIATNVFRFCTGMAFIKDVESAIRMALEE